MTLSVAADFRRTGQREGCGDLPDLGSMPCDKLWPNHNVALFKRWMDEGMAA
jgi:hypothetical protein